MTLSCVVAANPVTCHSVGIAAIIEIAEVIAGLSGWAAITSSPAGGAPTTPEFLPSSSIKLNPPAVAATATGIRSVIVINKVVGQPRSTKTDLTSGTSLNLCSIPDKSWLINGSPVGAPAIAKTCSGVNRLTPWIVTVWVINHLDW